MAVQSLSRLATVDDSRHDRNLHLRLGMAWLPGELQQGGSRAPPGLSALSATQTAGEIVHKGGRRVFHGCEVDVARCLAPRALDLQPWEATVDALGQIVGEGSIGSPSDHIRSFQLSQSNLVRLLDERFALCPLKFLEADCAARMVAIARALRRAPS